MHEASWNTSLVRRRLRTVALRVALVAAVLLLLSCRSATDVTAPGAYIVINGTECTYRTVEENGKVRESKPGKCTWKNDGRKLDVVSETCGAAFCDITLGLAVCGTMNPGPACELRGSNKLIGNWKVADQSQP